MESIFVIENALSVLPAFVARINPFIVFVPGLFQYCESDETSEISVASGEAFKAVRAAVEAFSAVFAVVEAATAAIAVLLAATAAIAVLLAATAAMSAKLSGTRPANLTAALPMATLLVPAIADTADGLAFHFASAVALE